MRQGRRWWAGLLVLAAGVLVTPAPSVTWLHRVGPGPITAAAPEIPRAVPASAGLPVIDYWTGPRGLPVDTGRLTTTGLRPTRRLVVYDAPGGRPRAALDPAISGLPVVVPIVARRSGWVAVLMPTANRRMGWLPPYGWAPRPLRDSLLVRRSTNELIWFRDGVRKASWTVALGAPTTPTPLGRTFVMGPTGTRGTVYAGLDALVLGSVPDDRGAVGPKLRGAHTGIHSWYRDAVFGRDVSNGCIRVPPAGQRLLLQHINPGTPVTVID